LGQGHWANQDNLPHQQKEKRGAAIKIK